MTGATRPPRRRAPKQPQSLGERLWLARERAGLTQRALGAKIGVGQAAVSAWEKDQSFPRENAWPLLALALGVSQDALETGKGFSLAALPDRVAESTCPYFNLPPIPAGVEVLVIPSDDPTPQGETAKDASRALREAVKQGCPVWVVIGR